MNFLSSYENNLINSIPRTASSVSFFSFEKEAVKPVPLALANKIFDERRSLQSIYNGPTLLARRPTLLAGPEKPTQQIEKIEEKKSEEREIKRLPTVSVSPERENQEPLDILPDSDSDVSDSEGEIKEPITLCQLPEKEKRQKELVQIRREAPMKEYLRKVIQVTICYPPVVEEQQEPVLQEADSYMTLRPTKEQKARGEEGKRVYFNRALIALRRYFPPASKLPLNCR